MKSAWGSDESTKASFAFLRANAFAEEGHEVQMFLLGEAVNLMRTSISVNLHPMGWPPLKETLEKTVDLEIPIRV